MFAVFLVLYIVSATILISGVATGWHGWIMSRGPGVKRAPRERDKKESEEKKRKKREKRKEEKKRKKKRNKQKKRGNETFQISGRGPQTIYPHESKSMTENTKIKHW